MLDQASENTQSQSEFKPDTITHLLQEVIDCTRNYLLLHGDCKKLLQYFPKNTVDCVITSPPYWKQRIYDVDDQCDGNIIGTENSPQDYVDNIVAVFSEIRKVLKQTGSVWLNIGDKYCRKNLMGIPWRVALAMQDDGWILRNDVIWNKMKGTQSAKDRLRSNYEHIFHFAKSSEYYYDRSKILMKPRKMPLVEKDKTVSATGVSGKRYRKQILESKLLSESERKAALEALENVLARIRSGELVDFRMTIRGTQRTLHSNNGEVSGRARELADRGFFILTSKAKGYMPADIWNIAPEDECRKDVHYAVFPIELLRIPIKATCPENGLILDPFVGTGSTTVAALRFMKRAIGIDICQKYVEIAESRLKGIQTTFSSFID